MAMFTRSALQSEKDKAKYERHAQWHGNKFVVAVRVGANLAVGNPLGAAKAYGDYKNFQSTEAAFDAAEAEAKAGGLKNYELTEAQKASMYAQSVKDRNAATLKGAGKGAAAGSAGFLAGGPAGLITTTAGAATGAALGRYGGTQAASIESQAGSVVGASIAELTKARVKADEAQASQDAQAAATIASNAQRQQKTTGGMIGYQDDDPLLVAGSPPNQWDSFRGGYV